jgi:hypothetical protein
MDQLVKSVEPQLTIDLADAQSIYRAYAASGVYGELVLGSGWSPNRFEKWLGDTLLAQLMRR